MTKTEERHKKDLRVVKTERAICEAFQRLLSQTEYSSISVAALSREANINRKTFYAHYATIDDLLESIYRSSIQEIYEPLLAEARQGNSDDILRKVILALIRALEDNFESEANLVRNIGFFRLADMVITPLEEYVLEQRRQAGLPTGVQQHRSLVCYVACLIAAYADWRFSHPKTETIEELAESIYRIVAFGASDLVGQLPE